MSYMERRQAIMELLYERKKETCENLAQEFGVSIRTIHYDLKCLMCSYPIETIRGRYGGGVRIATDFRGRIYLSHEQREFLKKVLRRLDSDEQQMMLSIISQFVHF